MPGDIIIFHMCTKNYDQMMYGSWDMGYFFPFSPLTTWKIKILTLKKSPGDIIILHICTTNDDHMMYGSWDMECNRPNFLSFWTILCPFSHYRQRKSKFWKNEKNTLSYYHFTHVYHTNDNHMIYGSWDMECDRQIFCHFWPFLALLPP